MRPSLPGLIIQYNLQQEEKEMVLTETKASHILKPIPSGNFDRLGQAPANEHLSMQLASQAFKIPVVPNALIYFENASGEAAHVSRRIYTGAQDAVKERFDEEYKRANTYEDVALLLQKYVAAYKPQAEHFFSLVLFSYLFSAWGVQNQNISIQRTNYGDYLLSPAYDIICSGLHTPPGSELLENTLFWGDANLPDFQNYGYFTTAEFLSFAQRIGILPKRARNIIDAFTKNEITVSYLVKLSFLNEESKRIYLDLYREKRRRLLIN